MGNIAKRNNSNDLDNDRNIHESTAIIKSNEKLVGQGLYNIGQELKYIRDNKTHKEAGYSSFKDYVEKELNYSSRHARNFIKISEEYNRKSISAIGNTGVTKLIELAKIEDQEERQDFIEDNNVEDMSTRELKKEIKARKEAEKEKEEMKKKLKEQKELKKKAYKKMEELEDQEPEVVVKERVPQEVQNRINELEERAGELEDHKSEVRDYKKKKKEINQEISELQEYKRKLKEENNVIAERAEVVQGVCGPIRKFKKSKGKIETLLKKEIELRKVDLNKLALNADVLEEVASEIYNYIASQKSNEEGDVIDV